MSLAAGCYSNPPQCDPRGAFPCIYPKCFFSNSAKTFNLLIILINGSTVDNNY